MNKYTVIWTAAADAKLAKLWLDNPKTREEITAGSRTIDQALAWVPGDVGVSVSERARLVVR